MAVINNTNIQILKYPGQMFGAKIQTPEVALDNAQAAHFVIESGEGTATQGKVQIMARRDGTDKESVLIREEDITIGANTENKIVVAAREIAHDEKCHVYLVIPNMNAANIVGCIFAVLTNERYSTEPER